MAVPDPSADPAVAPAAALALALFRAVPWTMLAILLFRADPSMPILVTAAWRLARRLAHGDRLADVVFPDLNIIVLVLIVRWSGHFPRGSASHWLARFAFWVTASSLTLGMAWGMVGPPALNPEALVWVIAVCSVFSTLYMLMFL